MIITEDQYLEHYGVLRKSGRYPWGSGGEDGGSESQRNRDFLGMVDHLHKEGLSEREIAEGLGITQAQLRASKSIAKNAEKQAQIGMAQRLKDKGYSNVAIGIRMSVPEATVRNLLNPGAKDKADVLMTTASMLKSQVDQKKYLDIGAGTEHHIGVSATKLNNAVAVLKAQGYEVHKVKIDQLGTGHQTELKVLAPPGSTQKEVWLNRSKIQGITEISDDGGRSFFGLQPPIQVNPKRVGVRYAEEGGTQADGVIYVRPNVPDLTLGKARYAQVRIAVGGTHYIKGMAMYNDEMPDGVDLLFNTNKKRTINQLDALKPLKKDKAGNVDEDNPFGSVVRQITKEGPGGKRTVTSAMNIVNEEGNWEKWSKSLSSQFLSKQKPSLAKAQLDMKYQSKKFELDEIMALTNPTVRRKLLESYADGVDSAAVHLKAAALPSTRNRVILPISSMKEHEVFAPDYPNGARVVLIRYPHGGIFEIPELTVNNRNPQARRLLGDNPKDAIGINHKVAEKLSGADFDGDTVMVIPNNDGKIRTAKSLEKLKGFDPQAAYPAYDGMKTMDGGTWNAQTKKSEFAAGKVPSSRTKGIQMGLVSNLITDMTIRGANSDELARAVRHSMVVIDAEKHNLNYRQSSIDNGIPALMKKYQGRAQGGASTLLSRASSKTFVNERVARRAAQGGAVDKATGKKVFVDTGRTSERNGKISPKMTESTKLAETDNAHTLSSGTPIEKVYAEHSNSLKALADQARKSAVNTTGNRYSPSAKKNYAKEVESLNAKLRIAQENAPRERQAQVLANAVFAQKRAMYADMDKSDIKKIKFQALQEARARTGADKTRVDITPNEWAAIQAGAITNNKLSDILANADLDQVKALATPKTRTLMNTSRTGQAKAMIDRGYTRAEVASALGVSVSTLNNSLGE